ncbi:MAG: phosphoribosyltransferase [Thermoplasmatales archaeon]|nr:phosphoribosyltransferase [Thermoplasmatales archaeon]
MKVEIITWTKAYSLGKILSRKIKSSGYKPDIVVAIGRGGYVPARIVCDFLSIMNLTGVAVQHWGAAEKKGKAKIVAPLNMKIKNKNVLVIDDITDTGETMAIVVKYLKKQKPKNIKTGVLEHKKVSFFVPDFFAHKIVKWRWITYPWARYEDLPVFIGKIGKKKIENIRAGLEKNFGIKISKKELIEILDNMLIDKI